MAVFPVFIEMRGKRIVVIGGGKVAERKICQLLNSEASIIVYSDHLTPKLQKLAKEGSFCFVEKMWQIGSEECLSEADLVICASSDRKCNQQVMNYCKQHHVLADCADSVENTGFYFPSLIRRNNIVIGISTSGGAPALSKYIRKEIEKVIPEWYGELEQTMRGKREELKKAHFSSDEIKIQMQSMIKEMIDRRVPADDKEGNKHENRN